MAFINQQKFWTYYDHTSKTCESLPVSGLLTTLRALQSVTILAKLKAKPSYQCAARARDVGRAGGKGFLARIKPWRRKCFEKLELQVLTEYAAGSFPRSQISKLRPNNSYNNGNCNTSKRTILDDWDTLY